MTTNTTMRILVPALAGSVLFISLTLVAHAACSVPSSPPSGGGGSINPPSSHARDLVNAVFARLQR